MKAVEWLRRADRAVLDVVYPERSFCLNCGRVSGGSVLCGRCLQEAEELRREGDMCPRCGRYLTGEDGCGFCRDGHWLPDGARSVWSHAGPPRKLVHRLKHSAVEAAGEFLGQEMAWAARELPVPGDAVVTWVPMPKQRLRQRGIDHGRVLAQAVAEELGLECRPLMERTVKKLTTQQGLNCRERQRNLRDTLRALPEAAGRTVLLTDDVLTTGQTANSCAQVLLEAGAERVLVVTATMP